MIHCVQESFTISSGFDGSAISYIINYTDSASGVVCASATILVASCVDDICEHDFRIAFTPCVSSSQITVSVCGTNVFGQGLPSTPVSIRGIIILYTHHVYFYKIYYHAFVLITIIHILDSLHKQDKSAWG